MKALLLITSLLIIKFSFGQIRFETLSMDNGMRYPKVIIVKNPAAQDSINKMIEASVSDLRSSDFCAGDFGYVQKGIFVQILVFCACIDMDESEQRYLFFNYDEGKMVPVYEIFEAKERENALKFILDKVNAYKSSDEACSEAFSSINSESNFDDLNIRLTADGIEIRPVDSTACEKSALMIPWKDLQSYVRLNFI